MKEHAKPSEATAETVNNHRFGAPLRLFAVPNANAPTLTAINTKRREIGREKQMKYCIAASLALSSVAVGHQYPA